MNTESRLRARHIFALTLALGLVGVLVWVIQLARQNEPVGYIILTGAGILLALLVSGFVVGLVLRLVLSAQPRQADNLKTVREVQQLMAQQNRELLRQLQQQRAALPAGAPVDDLDPGQLVTREGYVIDSNLFAALDEEKNG